MMLAVVLLVVCGKLQAALSTGFDAPEPAASVETDAVQVDLSTGLLRDTKGRTRIFHGVNVVYKQAPWYPPSAEFNPADSLDGKTMDLIRDWGFNVVRLGVMWPGVEPELGKVDNKYMDEMARLSGELAKRGIYTLIDLHQDVGSRRFCGEGFPEYYIDDLAHDPASAFSKAPEFPKPLPYNLAPDNATGVPDLKDCLKNSFGTYYMSDRVGAMWQQLYTAGTPLNHGFVRYWKAVSEVFASKPYVVGYELLNEPSGFCLEPGTWSCADAAKVVAGNSVEAKKLTPLYREAAKVIREVDQTTPIFYEATVPPKAVDVFPEPALGADLQQGLAYHIYCAPGDGAGPVSGLTCRATQDVFTHMYHSFLQKYGSIAGFMTEFGAIGGNPNELKHLNRLLAFADDKFQSWAYWMLKKFGDFTTANAAESLFDASGHVEVHKLKSLSRTYAPAIAGIPTKMSFDPDTGAFELSFISGSSDAPTELYLNEALHYPNGYALDVSPSNCTVQKQRTRNRLEIFPLPGAPCRGSTVTVKVGRRPPSFTNTSVLLV